MPAPELLGPTGLTIGAILAIGALVRVIQLLWREHLAADADDRIQRDTAIVGWREQTSATNRLAEAIEERNRDDSARQRRAD